MHILLRNAMHFLCNSQLYTCLQTNCDNQMVSKPDQTKSTISWLHSFPECILCM